MAHHQGMLLVVSSTTYLNEWCHGGLVSADSDGGDRELLLNERSALRGAARMASTSRLPYSQAPSVVGAIAANVSRPVGRRVPEGVPHASSIGNGRLTSLVNRSEAEAGFDGRAWLSPDFEPDASARSRMDCGFTCATRGSGHVWRATSDRGRTTFSLHKAEYHEREDGISIDVDVTLLSADDVELRQVTLRKRERAGLADSSSRASSEPVPLATSRRSGASGVRQYVRGDRIWGRSRTPHARGCPGDNEPTTRNAW